MAGNGQGSVKVDPDAQMRHFDRLSRELRDVLNEAPYNYAVGSTARHYLKLKAHDPAKAKAFLNELRRPHPAFCAAAYDRRHPEARP